MEPEAQQYKELTRRQLHELVWSTPMRKLAPTVGVSDVWLSKLCRECQVPTPYPGYWAKVQAGKRVRPRKLPKSVDPDEVVLHVRFREPEKAPELTVDEDIAAALERLEGLTNDELTFEDAKEHPLVKASRRALQAARKRKDQDETGILSIFAGEASSPLALHVSNETLEPALRTMGILLKALTGLGCPTKARDERHFAATEVLGEEYVLVVRERLKQRRLEPKHSYSPKIELYAGGSLEVRLLPLEGYGERRWSMGPPPKVARIRKVLKDTLLDVQKRRDRREQDRKDEEVRREQEQRRLQEEARRRQEQQRRDRLLKQTADWEQAERLRRFLAACREHVESSGDGDPAATHWLRWAESVVESLDPLAGEHAPWQDARGQGRQNGLEAEFSGPSPLPGET